MRFATVFAALAALTPAVLAGELVYPNNGFQCQRFNQVSWKGFDFHKTVILAVVDEAENIVSQKEVNGASGATSMYMPAVVNSAKRFFKLVIIDIDTKAAFASGQEFSVNCDKKDDGKPWDNHNMPWN